MVACCYWSNLASEIAQSVSVHRFLFFTECVVNVILPKITSANSGRIVLLHAIDLAAT